MSLVNIIIIVLAIGGPALGQFIQYMEKKRKAREQQKALEARQREAFRTGPQAGATSQTSPKQAGQTSAAARVLELQRRRQQQLDELRRRQQTARQQAGQRRQQTGRQTGQQPTQPPRPRPAGQPQASGRQGRGQQPPTPRPTQPSSARASARRERPQQPQPVPPPSRGLSSIPLPSQPIATPFGAPVSVGGPASAPAPVPLLGKKMTPGDWRRFIVARELLDPPIALRPPAHGPY